MLMPNDDNGSGNEYDEVTKISITTVLFVMFTVTNICNILFTIISQNSFFAQKAFAYIG